MCLDLETRVNFNPQSVAWYKDGIEISPLCESYIHLKDKLNKSYTLRIRNTNIIDTGKYSVLIDGIKSEGTVKIIITTPRFLQELNNQFYDSYYKYFDLI